MCHGLVLPPGFDLGICSWTRLPERLAVVWHACLLVPGRVFPRARHSQCVITSSSFEILTIHRRPLAGLDWLPVYSLAGH